MIRHITLSALLVLFAQAAFADKSQSAEPVIKEQPTAVAPSDKQAITWLMQGAQQGNGFAQFNLGYKYSTGEGVQKDDKKAAEWYAKAAEQDVADAQIKMAEISASGVGVPQSHQQAVYWYTRAAERGNSLAQYRLGQMYEKGQGVTADNKIAHAWYSIAAGNANAQAATSLSALAAGMKADDIKKAGHIADEIKEKISAAKKKK